MTAITVSQESRPRWTAAFVALLAVLALSVAAIVWAANSASDGNSSPGRSTGVTQINVGNLHDLPLNCRVGRAC